jgi:hypothetical protein
MNGSAGVRKRVVAQEIPLQVEPFATARRQPADDAAHRGRYCALAIGKKVLVCDIQVEGP